MGMEEAVVAARAPLHLLSAALRSVQSAMFFAFWSAARGDLPRRRLLLSLPSEHPSRLDHLPLSRGDLLRRRPPLSPPPEPPSRLDHLPLSHCDPLRRRILPPLPSEPPRGSITSLSRAATSSGVASSSLSPLSTSRGSISARSRRRQPKLGPQRGSRAGKAHRSGAVLCT